MKLTYFLSLLIFAAIIVMACEKDPELPESSKSEITAFLENRAPEKKSFTLSATSGGTITDDKIEVSFPANSFADKNGNPYNGTVTVKMQTVKNIAGMIYSRVTTISNGEMLISDGMFRLEAYDKLNNPLQLREGIVLSANFISADYNSASKAFIGIEKNNSDNVVEWEVWPDSTALLPNQVGTTIYGINQLFTWCNLDRFMNETPLTNITVKIPSGFTNVNSTCFFKYTGENAGAYLPSNATLEAFSTQASNYKVVQGRQAKIFIIAYKDEKWYYQIVATGAITADQVVNITSLTETSEESLEELITTF